MGEDMGHFNKLSPAETERLALLAEEMGEAIQIIGKILRHGYESHNPTIKVPEDELPMTNRQLLEKELGDVCCAIDYIAFDINVSTMHRNRTMKHARVRKYLHHQTKEASEVA